MKLGMLWFDNDPKKTNAVRVEEAAKYYQKKYGEFPNVCFTNPVNCQEDFSVGGISVRANKSVLPNHFWIGVNHD